VSRLIYIYAECCYAECHYAECCYAECHYAECCYAECHYAVLTSLRRVILFEFLDTLHWRVKIQSMQIFVER
jgi:hypothetical protein